MEVIQPILARFFAASSGKEAAPPVQEPVRTDDRRAQEPPSYPPLLDPALQQARRTLRDLQLD